jgi:ribose 5-phosphate isomerase RpiB
MMNIQSEGLSQKPLKRVGIAADHGGFELKEFLAEKLREAGFEVTDFGDYQPKVLNTP